MLTLARPARAALALPALAGLIVLSACGSSGSSSPSAAAAAPGPSSTAAPGAGGQRQPGTSGLVAAVSGSTAQVQSTTSQTAVTWTGATTFTATRPATLADVTVGSCVLVRSAATGQRSSAAPTPDPTANTGPIAATSVTVSQPVNGSCIPAGFGGGRAGGTGVRPTRSPGATPPSGAPGQGRGGFGGGGFGGFGGGASGTVTAVSADGFTVAATEFGGGGSGAQPSASTTSRTVTTSSTTTYTKETAGTAADVVVGVCVTAQGTPDSTGAVTATAIAVRPATNGSCTTGRPTGSGAPAAGGSGA